MKEPLVKQCPTTLQQKAPMFVIHLLNKLYQATFARQSPLAGFCGNLVDYGKMSLALLPLSDVVWLVTNFGLVALGCRQCNYRH